MLHQGEGHVLYQGDGQVQRRGEAQVPHQGEGQVSHQREEQVWHQGEGQVQHPGEVKVPHQATEKSTHLPYQKRLLREKLHLPHLTQQPQLVGEQAMQQPRPLTPPRQTGRLQPPHPKMVPTQTSIPCAVWRPCQPHPSPHPAFCRSRRI